MLVRFWPLWRVMAIVFIAMQCTAVSAGQLDRPAGDIVLTIDGTIAETNAPGSAEFDLAMLRKLTSRDMAMETPWTEGRHVFTGVLLADLMTAVGASGTTIRAGALNDYSADLPLSDARDFPVLVAWAMDGQALTAADRGPLWILYPFDLAPETRTETYYIRSVWNLERLTLR